MWGNILGAVVSGGLSFLGSKKRNEQQVASAREQMEFQREMSNTAHQRQVVDLRAAGLNPILSARYGGASTPGGAMAQIENSIGQGVSSALAASQAHAQVAKMRQEVKNAKALETNIKAQEREIEARITNLNMNSAKASTAMNVDQNHALLLGEQATNAYETRKNIGLQGQELEQRIRAFSTQFAKLYEEEKIDKSTYGKILRWINRLNPFASAAKAAIPGMRGK